MPDAIDHRHDRANRDGDLMDQHDDDVTVGDLVRLCDDLVRAFNHYRALRDEHDLDYRAVAAALDNRRRAYDAYFHACYRASPAVWREYEARPDPPAGARGDTP